MTSREDKSNRNITLRLPDEFHRQLVSQSERSGLTLNAHISSIVRRHLMDSGYFPDVIKSLSGRLFEIGIHPIPRETHAGSFFCSRFDVNEYHPLFTKRRAHYVVGVSSELAYGEDPYGVVRDVGLGLLNFYNRQGFELDQLAWQQTHSTVPIAPSPSLSDNWRYIGPETTRDIGEFLIALGRSHWKDDLLVLTGQSQDIRYGRRSEQDLRETNRRPVLIARQADFERYAYDTASEWIRLHGDESVAKTFSDESYSLLPRYVQTQIDGDEYHEVVLRCFAQLQSQPKSDR